MALALVSALVLLIGVSLGLSGIGGFLIPPLLVAALGVPPRAAVAAALISFVPSGLLGAWLYRRQRSFDLRLALALGLGTLPGVAIGREISLSLSEATLQRVLAVAVLAAAAALVLVHPGRHARSRRTFGPAVAIGCVAGVLTVLAGVGGPLVAVPALLLLGIDSAAAVGAALLASVVGSGLGAVALLPEASGLTAGTLAAVIGFQLAGVTAGVTLRTRIPTARLPQLIAGTAAVSSAWLFWRTFTA